ncbi:MAG: hypothetical protein JRJ00_16945 [Deltaproteobacteria bacterium]|nr:hypothetical protein [Deltaproteobacteria bacterium]
MPKKYNVTTKITPPRFTPIGKSGVVDFSEDCVFMMSIPTGTSTQNSWQIPLIIYAKTVSVVFKHVRKDSSQNP